MAPAEASEDGPTVSVVLAVHNGADHLRTAIRSVLEQRFEDFEFVVVDDGSTDDTPAILDALCDPRVRVLRQENSGQAVALNRGIEHARGRYVARIDDDDVAAPERLGRQVETMEQASELGVLGTWFTRRYEHGERVEEETVRPPGTDAALRREFPFRNPFAHSTVMFERDAARAVGGYDETLGSCIDYDLWLRIGATGYRFGMVEEVLNTVRKHPGSAYRFGPRDRLGYLRTAFSIRRRSVGAFELPAYYYAVPPATLAWWLCPERVRSVLRGVLPATEG